LCQALLETFEGFVPHPLVVAAAVVDGGECVIAVSPEKHTTDRFEIGSIGKTMTVTALSSLVLDGTLLLDDEIGRWLDAGMNSDITLRQLATHTSGLPRLAPNHRDHQADPADPYNSYGPDEAEAGLRASSRDTGERAYSNFGLQLLGLVVVRAAGADYDDAVGERVWAPLGMAGTSVTGGQQPIVQGYAGGQPVPPWHAPLPGPGTITSTIADMATYLSAVIAPPDGPVGRAISYAIDQELAWATTPDGWVWHNGGTAGAHTMLMAGAGEGRGAVALTNAGGLDELDQAVALAARGKDPRPARPTPVGGEFDEVIQSVVQELVANDWEALRSRMPDDMRQALTGELLADAWSNTMSQRGEFEASTTRSVVRAGGAVRADVQLTFSGGEGAARAQFDDERNLIGIQIN